MLIAYIHAWYHKKKTHMFSLIASVIQEFRALYRLFLFFAYQIQQICLVSLEIAT